LQDLDSNVGVDKRVAGCDNVIQLSHLPETENRQ
jgi:hypothetical protein